MDYNFNEILDCAIKKCSCLKNIDYEFEELMRVFWSLYLFITENISGYLDCFDIVIILVFLNIIIMI